MVPDMKTCSSCQESKAPSEFRAYNVCKVCAKARQSRYYKANPQKYIDKVNEYRRRNPDKRKVRDKTWRLNHPEQNLLRSTRFRAKAKGLPFNLELCDIVIPEVCPALGIVLERSKGDPSTRPDNMPTIDRLIPALGYVKGNTYIISHRANRIKQNATVAELIRIADYIRDHNQVIKGQKEVNP